MAELTRRNFLGSVGAAGALGAMGILTVTEAVAGESTENAASDLIQGGIINVDISQGADCPWSGPGSAAGDWQGTPDDIKALGGCTMPLDELNRRRQLYMDAQGEYTKADGTVVPAVYVKMRALINTYGMGIGNEIHDFSFDALMEELSEEEAQAFIDMPLGKHFTALDFHEKCPEYSVEHAEELCAEIARKGWLIRVINNKGTHYAHVAYVLGLDEYHQPEIFRGVTDLGAFSSMPGSDGVEVAFSLAGQPFFAPSPCSPEVVKDGAILPFDDIIAILETKDKFSLSPCYCRGVGALGAGVSEMDPNYPDGDWDISDYASPICGHDIDTCLCCGDEAQYWIDHKVGREITKEEAIARVKLSVEQGFIMQRMITKEAETICSCHGDCCGVLAFWQALGGSDAMDASRTQKALFHYDLVHDKDTCIQCGMCAQRCPMQAITMDGETGYPVVNSMCFRCGQCAYVCPVKARWLEPWDQDKYLPFYDDIVDENNALSAERFENGLIW